MVVWNSMPAAARPAFSWPALFWLALFALACGLTFGLTLACPIAPLDDFLNHLTRMHLLFDEGRGAASPYYRAAWALYPNLAMDLTVPALARWTGVDLAAQIFLLTAQMLIVSGAVALEWAVKRRFEYAGFIALLLLYSIPFAWGFVNFEFGCGVALWGVVAWIALREKSVFVRFAVHSLFVAALFACHMVALGLYGFTLGVCELHRAHVRRDSLVALTGTLVLLATPAAAALAAMALNGASIGNAGNDWDWPHKPVWPVLALNGFSLPVSLVGFNLLAFMALRLGKSGLRPQGAGGWLAPGFGLLYLATPMVLRDTAFVDVRVVVGGALILPAFISVRCPDELWRRRAAAALAALVLVNLAVTGRLWLSYRADYAGLLASFEKIPQQARIVVASEGGDSPFANLDQAPMTHGPTLAAHYRQALVTTLMATGGKQPLAMRPGFERLNSADRGPLGLDVLARIRAGAPGPDYLAAWPVDYDYLYYVGPPRDNLMPDLLQEIDRRPRFTLYRILKSPAVAQ